MTDGKRAIIQQLLQEYDIECILRRRVAAGALRVATQRYEWPVLIRLLYVQS